MSSLTFRSSQRDRWAEPKPYTDTSLRRQIYGKIQPMEEPRWWERLFRLR